MTTNKTITSAPANGSTYAVGETVDFNIAVTNTGNVTLTNVAVTDPLTGLNTTIESIEVGQTANVATGYTVKQSDVDAAAAGTALRNVATVTPSNPGTTPDNPGVDVPVPTANPAVTVNKTADTTSVTAGGTVNYTVTVTNNGNVTLNNIAFTDTLLANASNIQLNRQAATLSADGSLTIPTLASGSAAYITYAVTAPTTAGMLSNTATATATVGGNTVTGTDTYNVGVTTTPTTPTNPGTTPTTPTNPGSTPTTVTPAAATPINPVIATIATGLQNAVQTVIGEDTTPLDAPNATEETLDEEGTPLGAFDAPSCWVHWYIMLGILVTAVYGAGVMIRRRKYANDLQKREDHVLGLDEETEQAGATAPNTLAGKEA